MSYVKFPAGKKQTFSLLSLHTKTGAVTFIGRRMDAYVNVVYRNCHFFLFEISCVANWHQAQLQSSKTRMYIWSTLILGGHMTHLNTRHQSLGLSLPSAQTANLVMLNTGHHIAVMAVFIGHSAYKSARHLLPDVFTAVIPV